MHTRMHTHMHTRTSTVHVRAHTSTCARARAHTHTHTHTHARYDTTRDSTLLRCNRGATEVQQICNRHAIPLYWYKRFFMSDFIDTLLTFFFLRFLFYSWPLCMRVSVSASIVFNHCTHAHIYTAYTKFSTHSLTGEYKCIREEF
jgi:hypothetical protein